MKKLLFYKNYLLLAGLLGMVILGLLHFILGPINQPHWIIAFSLIRLFCGFLLILFGILHRKLGAWIWISLIIGIVIGLDFPELAKSLHVLSIIFLRLVKTLLAPLLFATLVYGIAGHGDLKKVGRMGWKSILYFEVVTTFALIIGVICINFSKAGVGIPQPKLIEKTVSIVPLTTEETMAHIFPENIAKSVAEGQILQVVIFSVLFGIGLALVPVSVRKPLLDVTQSLSEVMFKFTGLVMYLAPLAVGSAIAFTVASLGYGILNHLLLLVITFFSAIFLFILIILLPIAIWAKIPIRPFFQAILEPVSLAFATASSEAALPKAMNALENFGVSRYVISFVMPAGYSFNMDGGTLYLSLASIFIAQAGGQHLTIGQEVLMIFTLMLASKGIAGIPRAALAILAGMSASLGLASWPIFILFGIDGILDMGRSALNVLGNCLATVVIARSENEFDDKKALQYKS